MNLVRAFRRWWESRRRARREWDRILQAIQETHPAQETQRVEFVSVSGMFAAMTAGSISPGDVVKCGHCGTWIGTTTKFPPHLLTCDVAGHGR